MRHLDSPKGDHSPSSKRMAIYRQRRRSGMQVHQIVLHHSLIDKMVKMGHLTAEQRFDPAVLSDVIGRLLGKILDDAQPRPISPPTVHGVAPRSGHLGFGPAPPQMTGGRILPPKNMR